MKQLVIYLLLLLTVGCLANNPDPLAVEFNQPEEGMFEGEKGEQHTTDGLLIDSREEVDMKYDKISVTEAESLVNEYLHIDPQSDTFVIFDSKLKNGDYLIRVDHLTAQQNDSPQHTLEGWYTVNPNTSEINAYKTSSKQ